MMNGSATVLRCALVAGCIMVSASACQRAPATSSVDPLTGGTLVFEDDFDRTSFGEHWDTTSDVWQIVDGWVSVAGARNAPLFLNQRLPEQVRVEFLAQSASPDGDLKFEIFTDGENHESGYICIFGGWSNQLNIIARLDEHGDDRLLGADGVQVVQHQTYRFAVVRTGNVLEWFVDGEPFIAYDDPEPLRGDDHAYFAFNDWDVPLRFDEVRIYDLSE